MKTKKLKIFILLAVLFAVMSIRYSAPDVYAADDEANTQQQRDDIPILELPEEIDLNDYKIIETYGTSWSDCIKYDIQYDKYAVFPHYVVNLSSRRTIYDEPKSGASKVDSINYGEKFQTLALIEDENEKQWYVLVCEDDDEKVVGFIRESKVSKRVFEIEKMTEYLDNLTGYHDLGHFVYVENYRNANGRAPRLLNGRYTDDYGNRRDQAIAGYYDASMETGFRYIPDGTLGIVEEVIEISEPEDDLIVINNKGIFSDMAEYPEYFEGYEPEEDEEMTAVELYNENTEVKAVKIYIPSFDTSLWVKEKFISEDEDAPDELNQAVIVDRLNQTIAVFEYEDEWKVISMCYSSTGKTGQYSVPTPLGYFMAIEARKKFDYVEDGTTDIVGFAPYAIRFSAGGYLHGVPMEYGFTSTGSKTTPGYYYEYLASIGTIPRSHMCVRNYTSHAEFMYDWVDIGNCAVIVME